MNAASFRFFFYFST
ncbi:TPA: pheST operon leader peptide PheM [Escherichia coli]|nr:pheST operon leader peptide PheM [Escherichia coli]HAV7470411.1 pheST operon leader peptide PheM [Escherichia coli]HCH9378254.1 pheST operon leader peptide PheM [Escherichia coli]HCI4833607.1 pheST operon leader peptide PheM [Escherichia coli]